VLNLQEVVLNRLGEELLARFVAALARQNELIDLPEQWSREQHPHEPNIRCIFV